MQITHILALVPGLVVMARPIHAAAQDDALRLTIEGRPGDQILFVLEGGARARGSLLELGVVPALGVLSFEVTVPDEVLAHSPTLSVFDLTGAPGEVRYGSGSMFATGNAVARVRLRVNGRLVHDPSALPPTEGSGSTDASAAAAQAPAQAVSQGTANQTLGGKPDYGHSVFASQSWPGNPSGEYDPDKGWPPGHWGDPSATWPSRPPKSWKPNHQAKFSDTWDGHGLSTSWKWPPNHSSGESKTWGPNHKKGTSKTWPPNHAKWQSREVPNPPYQRGPGMHDGETSADWTGNDHATDFSYNDNWPPYHLYCASSSWKPGHGKETSQDWGPNHYGDHSEQGIYPPGKLALDAGQSGVLVTYDPGTGETTVFASFGDSAAGQ